jgi:hypothetical protein
MLQKSYAIQRCCLQQPSRTSRAQLGPHAAPHSEVRISSLHAATICGSIRGKAPACRFGVPSMIGRIQSDMIPRPLLAPLGTKPARVHAYAILAQGCQGTG